ncbi:MAG: hypothetical protein OXC91_01780 [Rhodobacteraceae bacterium]|nr:hypothetical protein [Paracoccaceae bacterium]
MPPQDTDSAVSSPAEPPSGTDGTAGSDPPAPLGGARPIAAHLRTGDDRTIVIGPAFRDESPGIGGLATMTISDDGGEIGSGSWRGSRDGSAGAAELLAFVQAFQT